MADSLRDQLIAAGYEAPKQKEKPRSSGNKKSAKKKPYKKTADKKTADKKTADSKNRQNSRQQQSALSKNNEKKKQQEQAIEERKLLKAKIKLLIDNNKIEGFKGEVVYRYLVDKRIRELYVSDKVHEQLADRSLAVTRLNGDTYLIPREIALKIKEINSQWSVFNLDQEAPIASTDTSDDYADFKVPDDLKW